MCGGVDLSPGSGNVYADLGFDEPDLELAKAELEYQIGRIVAANRWTQARAAEVLGIDQPKVSKIVRGRLGEFSLERLMLLLNRLNHDVRIVVAPNPSRECLARLTVDLSGEDETKLSSESALNGADTRVDKPTLIRG